MSEPYEFVGTERGNPTIDSSGIQTADGYHLPLRSWQADSASSPKAIVLALHGFNDYSSSFAGVATYMAARGISVYAYDQRGFGATKGWKHWPGWQLMVEDARMAARLLGERHPGVPVWVLGSSMGGAVALLALGQKGVADGGILVAPAVWGRETMPFYQRWVLAVGCRLFPDLALTGRGFGRKPSDNIEMLRALGRDPLVIKETRVEAVCGLTELMDQALLSGAAEAEGRLLFLYGMRDDLVPKSPTKLMLAQLPVSSSDSGKVEVGVYPDRYHMLLRDLAAETVWADVTSWILRGGALPSGASSDENQALLGFGGEDTEMFAERR